MENQIESGTIAVAKRITRHFLADGRLNGQFFAQFPSQRLLRRFPWLQLAARKFPLQRMASLRLALADQDQAVRSPQPPRFASDSPALGIIESRMHSERLLDHFRNPRGVGELPPPAVRVDVSNPACGDMLRLSVLFDGDRVLEARFQTRGCTASIAAGSALTEWMAGKSRTELKALTPAVIEEAVGGLEPAFKHAAILCVDAVKRLLA